MAHDVPVLQRLSSWDDDVDPSQRRGLTEEQAEMRWIMMVVGRSVGRGTGGPRVVDGDQLDHQVDEPIRIGSGQAASSIGGRGKHRAVKCIACASAVVGLRYRDSTAESPPRKTNQTHPQKKPTRISRLRR